VNSAVVAAKTAVVTTTECLGDGIATPLIKFAKAASIDAAAIVRGINAR
jgi:hypothetical protein